MPSSSFLSFLLARVEWTPLHLLIPLAIVQRIAELVIARRNGRLLVAKGAVEFGADHYPAIVALHVLWLAGMIVEIIVLSRALNPFWPALLVIYLLAQGLRYWALASLGANWNTRILVVPRGSAVRRGPYKWMKHPNYVAVVIELLVLPLMLGAYLTAITASIINAVLLRIRIKTEEAALREIGKGYEKVGAGKGRGGRDDG
jgi:methyltransferase